jgi:type I restriction enzyme S subunit
MKLAEFVEFNPPLTIKKGTVAPKVAMENIDPWTKYVSQTVEDEYRGGSKFQNGDTLVARITPCLENGKTAYIDFLDTPDAVGFGSTEFIVMRAKKGIADPNYVYYLAISKYFRDTAIKSMVGSSGRQRVQLGVLSDLSIDLPPLKEQRRISAILSPIDDKIRINKKINDNL